MTLLAVYPDQHPVRLVHAAGTPQERVEDLALYQIDRSPYLGLLTSLYLPPLSEGSAFESFQEIVAHLRAPDGCSWDREQTHLSLRNNLMEETYEALEALDAEDTTICARNWRLADANCPACPNCSRRGRVQHGGYRARASIPRSSAATRTFLAM